MKQRKEEHVQKKVEGPFLYMVSSWHERKGLRYISVFLSLPVSLCSILFYLQCGRLCDVQLTEELSARARGKHTDCRKSRNVVHNLAWIEVLMEHSPHSFYFEQTRNIL